MTANRARILVIDDDPLFRSLIVSLLRKDFFVSVAADGSEGFYKALEHPPDIAIIDVQMPVWDGLKTLKAFRSHPSLKHIKIMMLTGDASKETVLAAVHSGANDYVIKTSFSKNEFYGKLKKLLEAVPVMSPAIAERSDAAPLLTPGNAATSLVSNSGPHSQTVEATATVVNSTEPASSKLEEPMPVADDDADLQEIMDGWE